MDFPCATCMGDKFLVQANGGTSGVWVVWILKGSRHWKTRLSPMQFHGQVNHWRGSLLADVYCHVWRCSFASGPPVEKESWVELVVAPWNINEPVLPRHVPNGWLLCMLSTVWWETFWVVSEIWMHSCWIHDVQVPPYTLTYFCWGRLNWMFFLFESMFHSSKVELIML